MAVNLPPLGELHPVPGVAIGTTFAGIKKTSAAPPPGRQDLVVMLLPEGSVAAGVFTRNAFRAAPVILAEQAIARGGVRALVINSGNANAATAAPGLEDARQVCDAAADAAGVPRGSVLPFSTGVIGVRLPVDRMVEAMPAAVASARADRWADAARAIMTTDTGPKAVSRQVEVGGATVTVTGIAKGAGMIQPGMSPTGARPASMPLHATMLAYLTTDAKIPAGALRKCLRKAVASSFNCITVDGDMSTNDTVLLLANGLANNGKLSAKDLKTFQAALNHVCLELSKMMVRDGEGVTRLVTVRVRGAKTQKEADAAARAVGNSALVKTSWNGGDPNWGRIIDALGYSPAKVVEEKVDIAYSAPEVKKLTYSLKKGRPTRTSFETLCAAVAPTEFDLHINLNLGKGQATLYAADLTEEYVDFNKGDISDPASLGG